MFEMKYLQHDVDASEDPKCAALIDELGVEAYGRYWLLLEVMARASSPCIDLTRRGARAALQRALRTDAEGLMGFLHDLADFGLIAADRLEAGMVESDSFCRRREEMQANFENGKKGGRPPKKGGVKGRG